MTEDKKVMSDMLFVRLPDGTLKTFKEASMTQYGMSHPDLLREVITALIQGRVTLTPAEGQDSENLNARLYK